MKDQSKYVRPNAIIKENGSELSFNQLIDFASMVDFQEINKELLTIIIDTDQYYLSKEEKALITSNIIIEAPSSLVMIKNNLPDTIFKFSDEDKDVFYRDLVIHWKRLDIRSTELKAKITSYLMTS